MSDKCNDIISTHLVESHKYQWIFRVINSTDATTQGNTPTKLLCILVPIKELDSDEDEFTQLKDGSDGNISIWRETNYEEALRIYLVLKTGKLEHSLVSFTNMVMFLAEPFPVNQASMKMLMNREFFAESLKMTFINFLVTKSECIKNICGRISDYAGCPEYIHLQIYIGSLQINIYLGNDNNIYG